MKWKVSGAMLLNESAKMQEMLELKCGTFWFLIPGLPPSQTTETDVVRTFL